jgi:hypothetical protein
MKSKYHENQGDFHVGKILKSYIDKHKIAKSALARKIKRGDSTIIHYQKSASIQISIVNELCHALKHNFFADLAAHCHPPTPRMHRQTAPKTTALPHWSRKTLF